MALGLRWLRPEVDLWALCRRWFHEGQLAGADRRRVAPFKRLRLRWQAKDHTRSDAPLGRRVDSRLDQLVLQPLQPPLAEREPCSRTVATDAEPHRSRTGSLSAYARRPNAPHDPRGPS